MRRTRMLALCTLAVLATSAVAAATASAFTIIIDSEGSLDGITIKDHIVIGRCLELTCASMSAPAGNVLTGVSLEGVQCHSAGAKEGEVKTEPVTDELGYINKAKGEVGLEERPTKGTLLARFNCGTTKAVELRGGVIGVITPVNKPTKAAEHLTDTVAVEGGGKQAVTKFEGGPTVVLEKQVNGGGFTEAPADDSGTLVPSGTVEVKTTPTPEFSFTPEAEYGQCLAAKKGFYADPNCQTRKEKNGKPKGKFEWRPGAPASCTAAKKGEYTDPACTVKSAKPHKGKFEKTPGPGFTSTGGTVELSSPAFTLVCKASSGAGSITSPTASTGTQTFTGCEAAGKKCTSLGQAPGTVARAAFVKEIIIWWNTVKSAWGIEIVLSTAYIFQFNCEGVAVRISGSGTTLLNGNNVMSTTRTRQFVPQGAEQGLETEIDTGTGFGPPEPTVEKAVMNVTYASPVEVKTP